MLAWAGFPANANGVKLPCRHEYARCRPQYARSAEAVRDRTCQSRRHRAKNSLAATLIGDFAAATADHLTAFLRAGHRISVGLLTWAYEPRRHCEPGGSNSPVH